MKKTLVLIGLSLMAAVMAVRSFHQRKDVIHITGDHDPPLKNFSAFPPDLPEEEFEDFFR